MNNLLRKSFFGQIHRQFCSTLPCASPLRGWSENIFQRYFSSNATTITSQTIKKLALPQGEHASCTTFYPMGTQTYENHQVPLGIIRQTPQSKWSMLHFERPFRSLQDVTYQCNAWSSLGAHRGMPFTIFKPPEQLSQLQPKQPVFGK